MRRPAAVYGLTLAAVAAAGLVRGLFDPLVGNQLPWVTFVLPVALAAWLGGVRPALLATVVGYLAGLYLFVEPRYTPRLVPPGPWPYALATYFAACLTLTGFAEAIRAARRRAAARGRLLEATLAGIGDAVVSADATGRVTFLNGPAAELTGWAPAEAAGRPLADVVRLAGGEAGRPADPAGDVLRLGRAVDLPPDAVLAARGGPGRPVEGCAAPVRDDAGAVAGVVLAFRDVTARRRAERQLQFVADHAPILLAHCDADHRYKFVNRPYAERLGLHPRDLVGRRVRDVLGEQVYTQILPHMEAALAGRRVEYEAEVPYPGLGPQLMQVTYEPEVGPGGRVVGYVAAITNVTDRKRAEHVLGRYRLLSQHARDVVLFVRPGDGRIVEANDAAVRAYGYARDALLGLSIADLRDPATAPLLGPQMEQAAAAGLTFETRHRRRDGSTFPVEVSSCGAEAGGERLLLSIVRDVTDRKLAEDARARSEARYRQLFEQSPLAVQVFDPDGRLVRANRAWSRLWGVTLDQLAGYNLLADQQLAERGVLPLIRRAFAGEAVQIPAVGYVPDRGEFEGQERWVRSLMYPLLGEGGRVEEVVLLQEDETDRRRAEERLRFQAHLLDSVGQAAIATRPDGTVVYWNRAAEALYGWPAADALGRNIADLTPADVSRAQAEEIMGRLAAGETWAGEFSVRRRDGTRFPAFVTDSPVRDEAGRVVGVIGVSTDVSARNRAEGAARFLADAGASLAALVDPETTLQQVARMAVPAFADWCSVDLAEEGGGSRRVAVAHADPARAALVWDLGRRRPPGPARVFRSGRPELVPEVTEADLADPDDPDRARLLRELAPRSYLGVPLAARGRTIGAISFVAAGSGRRYDGHDLAVAEELARRASVALENAHLYQALKEADRRKDEFLALLAHELRNPLAPIRNALQVLSLPGADAGTAGQARALIERQVDHLVRMVDDLMDVSRVMRGRVDLRRECVELAAVVARAVETARPQIDAGRHRMTVDLPPDPVWLDADPVRLAQVFANLLNNAAKYTEPGGAVTLSARRDGADVVVRVADTGVGIPADLLPRVFDLFVQADQSLGRARGGLGIGLTVVKSLVGLHGGTVRASSPGPGRGSVFEVRLPAPADAAGRPPARPPAPSAPPRRVLVVDDNADAADSLAMLLRLGGHDVRVAYDGPAALAAAREFGPQVAFLDIGMPGMDGYEVARRLQAEAAARRPVLVALTGWGQAEDRRRTTEAGFDLHLVKPADLADVNAILAGLGKAA